MPQALIKAPFTRMLPLLRGIRLVRDSKSPGVTYGEPWFRVWLTYSTLRGNGRLYAHEYVADSPGYRGVAESYK
jgi:hypothetical protein